MRHKLKTKKNERLCKLQKRAARIKLSADYLTPSAQMFTELRWPTIKIAITILKDFENESPRLNNLLLKD